MSDSVLVVEDDSYTREYFADALRGDAGNYAVMTAASLTEALAKLEHQLPDVMLVDLGLPDGSGLDLIRSTRGRSADVLILVITVFGDEASVIGAIEAGAQGYLLKSEGPKDLCESVRQVQQGGAPISPGIASHLLRRFQTRDSPPSGEPGIERLTSREREVLELLVRGLLYQEVAAELGVTRNTVTSHVKSIYRKLEVSSRGEAVFQALSRGIVRLEHDD